MQNLESSFLKEGGLGEMTTCVRRMNYLSQMFLNSSRLDEAEKLQRKILHIFELSKGWDSLETIIAAESLALTMQTLGILNESQDLLERCLDARKKILPHDHIQVAANLLHLGRVAMHKSNYLRKVNISEATEEIEKAKSLVDDSIRDVLNNLVATNVAVMRYMKEIIQDSERAFVSRWSTKNRKVSYSRTELDEVRFEALSHIEGYM